MATEKISLTLDKSALAQARAFAGKRGLSSYVSEALQLKLQQDALRRLLDELELEHGPIPQAIQQEIEEKWPIPEPERRSA